MLYSNTPISKRSLDSFIGPLAKLLIAYTYSDFIKKVYDQCPIQDFNFTSCTSYQEIFLITSAIYQFLLFITSKERKKMYCHRM